MKQISLLLTIILLVALFSACGSLKGESSPSQVDATTAAAGNQASVPSGTDAPESVQTESLQPAPAATSMDGSNVLVAYFSCTGTTEVMAGYIAEALGADLYEIEPEEPYTDADLDYNNDDSRTSAEQNDDTSRPAISRGVEKMEEYDIVFLGYPIWWGQAPRIISTFLESYDFSGKTLVPFCTSGSSGIGSSADHLHDLCADSTVWLTGTRFASGTSRDDVVTWINELGLNLVAE